jgi:hypothetical protein
LIWTVHFGQIVVAPWPVSTAGSPQQMHGTTSAKPVRRWNRLTATTPDAVAG